VKIDEDLARTAVGVQARSLSGVEIAQAFRHTFFANHPSSAVAMVHLFELLGEFTSPPADPHELARWAGKRQVAHELKAALYAPLHDLPQQQGVDI
jgi:hypothetical protein